MERLSKETFVQALPELEKRLKTLFPRERFVLQIANGTASPRNPFPPKLSSAYNFRVIVHLNSSRSSFIPYLRPPIHGPFGTGGAFISERAANPDIHTIVKGWCESLHTRAAMAVAKVRMSPLKEELMVAAWHPRRVERWLAISGWDMFD